MGKIVIYLLRIYQKINMVRVCRFYPTCSQYAIEAIEAYGFVSGLFLAFKRIIRCNQYFPGGYDPVK